MYTPIKLISLLTLLPAIALAVFTPNTPDSTTVVKVGQTLTVAWAADTQGLWSNLEIQLMAGSNLAMQPLAVLATGINAATTTSFSIPCPDVSPYSAIYFCQFTQGGNVSTSEWTTRFTIAGADGSTTTPANSTVYSGTTVAWGNAVLVSSSNTTAASSSGVTSTSGSTIFTSATSTTPSSSSASPSSSSASSTRASSVSAASASTTSAKSGAMGVVTRSGILVGLAVGAGVWGLVI